MKAVVTARDIVDFPLDKSVMLGIQDMRWMCRNVMAREKVLFPGHPVAAVAATTEAIAAAACSAACRPIDDKRGTIAYRTKVAGVLLKRTTAIAAQRAKGN